MEDHRHPLLQPLITTTTITKNCKHANDIKLIISSNSSIIFRFFLIILIGSVSIWANYEASKGFNITIINAAANSYAGKRFQLFYVSDDKATRIVLNTSLFVQNFLYPEEHPYNSHSNTKQVNHVILRLANRNMTTKYYVESTKNGEYFLHLSPSILDEPNFNHVIVSTVLKGMSHIWLWNGQGNVPHGLINGMIEYISSLAGFSPELNSGHREKLVADYSVSDGYNDWNSKNPRDVAQLLDYCEKLNEGFIRRLNHAMKNGWHKSIGSNCLT